MALEPTRYSVKLRGIEVAAGEAMPGHLAWRDRLDAPDPAEMAQSFHLNLAAMGLLRFYLKKLWAIFKGEVLVLPSRIVAFLFFALLLLLPLWVAAFVMGCAVGNLDGDGIDEIISGRRDCLLIATTDQPERFDPTIYRRFVEKGRIINIADFWKTPANLKEVVRLELLRHNIRVDEAANARCNSNAVCIDPIE